MSIIKVTYSMMILEITVISRNQLYFGSEKLNLASTTVWLFGYLGGVAGNSFAAFLDPYVAVWITFAIRFVQIGVVCSFTDK